MIGWLGLILIAGGAACLPIDRQAAHWFYDHINEPFFLFLRRTTHGARGGYWIAASVLAYVAAETAMHFGNRGIWKVLAEASLAFICCIAVGSIVLHIVKRIVARRRPRDDMEMGLYGFVPLSFDSQYNSFPSGHALTIMCAAVVAACVWPKLTILWFAGALWLSLTRAFLVTHFLSDVFVGAGIALVASRETLLYLFPRFVPLWF